MTFTAPDYDTLVDAPTEMGNFDLARFEIEGKPHYFVATPAGVFSKEKTDEFVRILTRIATTQRAIFGELPYDKYVYYYFFARPESDAGGALEHANSFVAFAPPGNVATPDVLADTAAHEFFHLWNVKRIRPVELWPYDYTRERETPLLWVSEGFTNYYTQVTLYRSGLRSRAQFLDGVADTIGEIERNEARAYVSPAASSVSTWLCYDTPCAFSISYYRQGQNLGALLDLSIHHDTAGAASLDDVMRALDRDFYLKGRGFSTQDLISIINGLTKRDYRDFFRRYVTGTEVPRYEEIFGAAGLRLERQTRKVPVLDVDFETTPEGILLTHVPSGSPFARAGLRADDLLLMLDRIDLRVGAASVQQRLAERLGQKISVKVKRAGKEETFKMEVGAKEELEYKLTESPRATPEQLRIREAWLRRTGSVAAASAAATTRRLHRRARRAVPLTSARARFDGLPATG